MTRLVLLVFLALIAASCGVDESVPETAPSSTATPSTTVTTSPPATTTATTPDQTTPPPTTEDLPPVGLPVESRFIVFGPDGIRAVTPEAALVEVSTTPTAAAFAVGDSLVVSQGIGSGDVTPPIGEGPIRFHTPNNVAEFIGADGQRIRLLDAGVAEGRIVVVATIESGNGPEDTEINLVLIDAATLAVTDLGVVGWWEAGIAQAALVGDVVVTIQTASINQHMAGRSLTGELIWEVKDVTDPDSLATLGGGGDSLFVLKPRFDADFNALLGIDRYDPATGRLVSSEQLVVDAEFGGGYCRWADWDGEVLICSESYGAPFVVDVTSGAVDPLLASDLELATHTVSAPAAP